MKAKILAALKTKFTGVQDAILNRVADKIIKGGKVTKEDEITTAVDGVTFQQVLEMYGDSRANEASVTAVRNYETEHKLKDGKAIETTKPAANADNNGGGESVPEWAKTLIEANKAMTERLNAFEKGRTTESRRARLDAVVGKLPETLRKAYARTPVESQTDEEFTTLLADVTNEVAAIESNGRAAGAVTGRPMGGSATNGAASNGAAASDAEVDAVLAHLNV